MDIMKMDIKTFLNFVELIEKQEELLQEKKDQYSEEDVDQIKKLLRAGKTIKDKRLKDVYEKLKDAGIFD